MEDLMKVDQIMEVDLKVIRFKVDRFKEGRFEEVLIVEVDFQKVVHLMEHLILPIQRFFL